MDSSDRASKHYWLADLLAWLLAVACAVWAIREHEWPVSVLIVALAVAVVVRNRKAKLEVPAKYSGLMVTMVAVLFAGPFLIVLTAISRPQIVLPTVVAVALVYVVMVVAGALIRRRLLR
jgi:FtsH-binding integral membrane protein